MNHSIQTQPPQVLIVGAGPVGLVHACELLQQGITVRLIDKAEAPRHGDPHSRAILVVPRALELLRRIGVSGRLAEAGQRVPAIAYYSDGRLLGTARFNRLVDTPYPFLLALPQRNTESLLQQRLRELGGTIERGVCLSDRANLSDPQRPRVVLQHRDGSTEEVTPQWLIGADGAASATRKLLGLELDGDSTDVTYVIADAPITGAPAHAQYYYSSHGLLAVIPMRDGLYRVAGNVPHRDGHLDANDDNSADSGAHGPRWRALLQELIDQRAGVGLTVGPPTYTRLVRPRCGQAPSFRTGRCFLIGDAAHVITPAGGQGMNLGIEDAVNLGWKLGGVLRGRLPESVLETYHSERSAAVARMSATTARLVGLAQQRSRPRIALRNMAFMAAERTGLVQRALPPLLGQLDVNYGNRDHGRLQRPLTGRTLAGQRIPLFAPLATESTGRSGPVLDRDGYTVLLWPGERKPPGWAATCAGIRDRLTGRATLVDLATTPDPASTPGTTLDALRRAFGRRPCIAVARPDGYLAHLTTANHPEETLRFLDAAGPREKGQS